MLMGKFGHDSRGAQGVSVQGENGIRAIEGSACGQRCVLKNSEEDFSF